jgi:hypothetical protein
MLKSVMNNVKILCKKSVFRSDVGRLDRDADPVQNDPQNKEKVKIFHVLKGWMQCYGAENISFDSGSRAEPQIRIAAPATVPALDSFIRNLENLF